MAHAKNRFYYAPCLIRIPKNDRYTNANEMTKKTSASIRVNVGP
jgi:predicted metal-binding protein